MITVTLKAAEKIREILKQDGHAYLRIFVQGGGCSGFQYGLTTVLAEERTDSDKLHESNGIVVLIDPVSLAYLKDAEVDFIENTIGGGFAIKNPSATSTCGCGQSFSAE